MPSNPIITEALQALKAPAFWAQGVALPQRVGHLLGDLGKVPHTHLGALVSLTAQPGQRLIYHAPVAGNLVIYIYAHIISIGRVQCSSHSMTFVVQSDLASNKIQANRGSHGGTCL